MDPEQKRSFIERLDEHHRWPGPYMFKFIVPAARIGELRQVAPGDHSERPSKGGKYISLTARAQMASAAEVWGVYEQAAHIEGLLSL